MQFNSIHSDTIEFFIFPRCCQSSFIAAEDDQLMQLVRQILFQISDPYDIAVSGRARTC